MKADYRVFIDACVLANFSVCDLLLRLSERPRMILPCWSQMVLDEVQKTHVEKLKWPSNLAESFRKEIRQAFPEAEIHGFEYLILSLSNDTKDRHVLAAAIHGNCPLILTFNLRHFPVEALARHAIRASHPEDYLLILYEMDAKQVTGCLGEIAGRRKLEIEDVLIRLGKALPSFSAKLLDDLNS